ncbi:restriction endonuclease [Streptomyces sp. NPDC050617]|uniref:restriction endonuclease n=1 Tax=Streptomyces sp. NPDC050617 TaxID=3154628 RepID=UPI003446F3BA
MDLEELLNIMDRAAANLAKLEDVWKRAARYMPTRHSSQASTPEYEDLSRAWADLLTGLPPIDGWKIVSPLPDIEELGSSMFQAFEAGVSSRWVEKEAEQPERDLAEYRHRLNRARRRASRDRLQELLALVDTLLPQLLHDVPRDSSERLTASAVELITSSVAEIERLLGDTVQRLGRWSYLHRHLAWGQGCDWHDIAAVDWPSVRTDIVAAAFSETEPMPVPDIDLGRAASERPSGQATTALTWDRLPPEEFERLLFDLLRSFPEHENVKWLSHTNAPDRGRDLSMDRVVREPTGDSRIERVIIQAKHWRTKSVNVSALAEAIAAVEAWEPPVVHNLIVATSGRFSSDAIGWAEQRNNKGATPRITLWAESDLEALLTQKPYIVPSYNLRPGPVP